MSSIDTIARVAEQRRPEAEVDIEVDYGPEVSLATRLRLAQERLAAR